jgi:hypothetical protein
MPSDTTYSGASSALAGLRIDNAVLSDGLLALDVQGDGLTVGGKRHLVDGRKHAHLR